VPHDLPSQLLGRGLRVGVLVTRWYPEIVGRLKAAALAGLAQAGVRDDDVLVLEVPGAYELPQAAVWLARDGWQGRPLDAVVALGCVLRGETPHFDHVCRAAVDGLLQVALDTGVPVGLGVITADTLGQAEARSRAPSPTAPHAEVAKGGNKGHEAVDAALRMAATRRRLCAGGA
jgi:6,7-dimethyl-8-ribityllumazine synthase